MINTKLGIHKHSINVVIVISSIIVIAPVQICTLNPAATIIIPHRLLRLGEIIY